MTKVKFFRDFYCFEYQAVRQAPQRVHYYLVVPVYSLIPLLSTSSTAGEMLAEKTVFSSDFLPSRLFRELESCQPS